MSRPFLDTNVLIYASMLDGPRVPAAVSIVQQGGCIGAQVLAEFAAVARRRLRMSWPAINGSITAMLRLCPDPIALDAGMCADARRIAERYGYHVYDSQIIAAALAAGSRELLSEDMQHGQVIDGRLTIRNPFL